MYTEIGGSNVPAFLTKLWKLVEDYNYNDLISWSNSGKSFIIRNQAKFAKELLPLYFKHNNMASFIRQLNMYGFRKLTHIENSGLKQENDEVEFYHSCFIKDQESLLEFIKRKNSLSVTTQKFGNVNEKVKKDDVHNILSDVKGIKGKQETIDNILVKMQCENEALWREISILRHKHQKQQKIVAKLIHFLVTIVHSGSLELKRKLPLMIDNKTVTNSKKILTSILSKSGPIIHEITNNLLQDNLEVSSPIINSSKNCEKINIKNSNNSPVLYLNDNNENNKNNVKYIDPLQESINAINENGELDLLNDDNTNLLNEEILNFDVNLTLENDSKNTEENKDNNENVSDTRNTIIVTSTSVPKKDSNLKLAIPQTAKTVMVSDENNCLVPSTSSSVLNTPNVTFRNFDDHLDEIDLELNNLQQQLLQGGCIDSNVLMGLFSVDDINDCLESNEIIQSSARKLPAITIQDSVSFNKNTDNLSNQETVNAEMSENFNSNSKNQNIENEESSSDFDLCNLVSSNSEQLSSINYDSQKDLFEDQNILNATLIENDLIINKERCDSVYDNIDNTSMFDTDDLLSTEDEINQLLNVTNTENYCHEKKRRKIT